MSILTYKILKSEVELKKIKSSIPLSLMKMGKLHFWKSHFKRNKFNFNPEKFDWEYWTRIPLTAKKDLAKQGIKKRLQDAGRLIRNDASRFILVTTSGTSAVTRPLLLIKNIDSIMDGEGSLHSQIYRPLFLYQSRALSLRNAIALIRLDEKSQSKSFQGLICNPFRFKETMTGPIMEINPDSIVTFPSGLQYLNSVFPKIKRIFSRPKQLWMTGDFISKKQLDFIKTGYPNLAIDYDYMMSEVDIVGICCKFLRKQHGLNAYHPFKDRILELINIDGTGMGELVVTKLSPVELGYIRYKTGDLAQVINGVCKCGNEWAFSLSGRKHMDYIKALGVLITRAEIERVIQKFETEIEEWRGEVHETNYRDTLLAELILFIKLNPSHSNHKNKVRDLKEYISSNLRLTPYKTLAALVKEKKFMPLRLNLVEQFPPSSKKILLRKVTY